ncbi:MAG TPA: hypothetical protein PKM25_13375, partial [Candidatus Ozemobacteraceae bacterium]|nr:hypothetical protein [Candidatus Ozemobacteraceae bacterium]
MNIRNTGQATAIIDTASLTFNLGTFDQSLTSPALPYALAGGTNVDFVYDIGVSPSSVAGNSLFTSNVYWHDDNWPASTTWITGAPPSDDWDINAVGIKLSSDEDFNFEQVDFSRSQRMFIRAFGVTPSSKWYRIRVYNSQIAQTTNVPAGFVVVSPLLMANEAGEVDFYYDIPAAGAIGTWSAVLETDADSTAASRETMLALQYFRVQYPGDLVASLTISPAFVFVGENFTVTMVATNTVTSGSTIRNASPSNLIDAAAFPNFGGSATKLSGPSPASFSVKALQSDIFSWTYQANSDTGLTASYALTVAPAAYAAGYDLNSGAAVYSNYGVSSPLIIYSRRIQMSPDSLDFGTLSCGETAKADGSVMNIGNYQLDKIKWITIDMNGPGGKKISKANLTMSPANPLITLAGGANMPASVTLFVPYNKEAGDYVATMSVYNDRNSNDLVDIDEAYDLFNVKVTVPSCKKVFTVQESIDLGAWPIGQTSKECLLSYFNGGNAGLDNVKLMQLPGAANGTNTFAISATPNNPGPLGITDTGVASIVANLVDIAGVYIATWTIWNDVANPGVVDPGEASDTFQVRVQVGIMNFTLSPATVDAGSVEPSGLNLGFGLNLTNDPAGLPLTKLKLDNVGLTDGFGNTIASENIAIYTVNNPIPSTVGAGQTIPIDLALFIPAGKAAGTYSATQYIYHDDNGNGKWNAGEFRASFILKVTVPAVSKVQVMTMTVGLGGIQAGTSKIV